MPSNDSGYGANAEVDELAEQLHKLMQLTKPPDNPGFKGPLKAPGPDCKGFIFRIPLTDGTEYITRRCEWDGTMLNIEATTCSNCLRKICDTETAIQVVPVNACLVYTEALLTWQLIQLPDNTFVKGEE